MLTSLTGKEEMVYLSWLQQHLSFTRESDSCTERDFIPHFTAWSKAACSINPHVTEVPQHDWVWFTNGFAKLKVDNLFKDSVSSTSGPDVSTEKKLWLFYNISRSQIILITQANTSLDKPCYIFTDPWAFVKGLGE